MRKFERYDLSLFDACERLHVSNTGTGDRVTDDELRSLVSWLDNRYIDWQQSLERDQLYDDVVRELVRVTLLETIEDRPTAYVPGEIPVEHRAMSSGALKGGWL